MLTKENNDLLTRVGPGTPMGQFMREYWIPALLSTELPAPDCHPLRVMLLGERLVAFRDSNGRVGLLSEACPHRGASLFYGRSTECGIRCIYHGWAFDVAGTCIAMPTEEAQTPLKRKVRAKAYPCVERGGLVWTYMGTRSTPPPLPDLEANVEAGCRVDATMIENNWLQTVEGDIDLAHLPHLHADNFAAFADVLSTDDPTNSKRDPNLGIAPRPSSIEVVDTPGGFAFAADLPDLPTPKGERAWMIGHFLFPFYANLPYGALGNHWVIARVPMDDSHTMCFGIWNGITEQASPQLMFGPEPTFLANTSDWFGRFRLARNGANDFGLNPESRRNSRGLGVAGQATQDAAITWSMGPIVDRTREHLGRADVAIIHLRKRLLAAVRELRERGAPAVDVPRAYRVKHGTMTIKEESSWFEELHRHGGAGQS